MEPSDINGVHVALFAIAVTGLAWWLWWRNGGDE